MTASIIRVNPLPGLAQETSANRTPCSGQSTRGTRAINSVLHCQKFTCLHRFSTVSCAGEGRPHSGQGNRWPSRKSSRLFQVGSAGESSLRVTFHSGPNCKAIANAYSRPCPKSRKTPRAWRFAVKDTSTSSILLDGGLPDQKIRRRRMARTPFLAIPQWQICLLRPFHSAKSRVNNPRLKSQALS